MASDGLQGLILTRQRGNCEALRLKGRRSLIAMPIMHHSILISTEFYEGVKVIKTDLEFRPRSSVCCPCFETKQDNKMPTLQWP